MEEQDLVIRYYLHVLDLFSKFNQHQYVIEFAFYGKFLFK